MKPWSHIEGYLAEPQPTILNECMSVYNRSDAVIVEVGSWTGRSSVAIASAVPRATLYCVDPWPDAWVRDAWLQNTRDYTNIVSVQGSSPHCIGSWGRSVDAVFLDASHTNPNDWDNCLYWIQRIRPGGLFMGHDYSDEFPDVVQNVNKLAAMLRRVPQRWSHTSLWAFNWG